MPKRHKPKPLNTTQLAALRRVLQFASKGIGCDRSTGMALVARGFAEETAAGSFIINDAGRERARFKADIQAERDGLRNDPSLMEDLP